MGAPEAIFLSYASEDAEAARHICDALRAVGLEAWFDQSELRGGDAWDQKIRRQIKDCAIFMPLISAATNARAEGYFRLEWKLAVDRSHLMADDAPFLVPVAIDATSEDAARVPDRFREVQWMRLGKHSPEEIATRMKKLIAGEAKPSVRVAKRERPLLRPGTVWPAIGISIFLFFVTQPMWRSKPGAPATAAPATEKGSEATQLARRAIEPLVKLHYTRDTLATSADLARKASELDSTLALAWGARARVEATWLHRNWDTGEARRRAAQDYARRAMGIDPEEPNALWSQGMVLRHQRALPEAEAMFQRAMKRSPDNEARRALAAIYRIQGRESEAIAAYQDAIKHDPRDPLAHFSLSLVYASTVGIKDNDPANLEIALGHLDRALAIEPFGTALVQKAVLLATRKGDFDGARAALARLAAMPHEESAEDRAIFTRMWIPLLERQPERALEAGALTTSTYFVDTLVAGPIAWMKALAHQQAGRESAAAEEWRAAEAVLRARLAAAPDSLATQAELAVTLAMLGRREEAASQFRRYDATMREQGRTGTLLQVRYHCAMGDGKRAAEAVSAARKGNLIWFTDAVLARDPWFDRVRGKAEFKALMKPA